MLCNVINNLETSVSYNNRQVFLVHVASWWCHPIQVTGSRGQKVLFSLEKEFKDGHREDLSRRRLFNTKQS
jgi:hypothetical protein